MVLVQILMLTSSYAIAKIIGVVFIYFFTRHLNRSFKRAHGIIAYSAPEGIHESADGIEKIVAMDFIENSAEIALLKVADNDRLFIEIVDANLNHKETISLADEIFNTHNFNNFQCLPDRHFYFNISNFQAEKWNKWHLKIDFSGNTIEKVIDDLEEKYKYSHDRNLVSSLKIDDYGNDIKFSNDHTRIVYWCRESQDKKGFLIQYVILKLDEFSITEEKKNQYQVWP